MVGTYTWWLGAEPLQGQGQAQGCCKAKVKCTARTLKKGSAVKRENEVSYSASLCRWKAATVPEPGRPCHTRHSLLPKC